jgi:hypothetical protein
MKQTQKLNALISKIIKEELDKSQKGTLDVTIPSKFAFALADPRVSDDPSYVSFMKSKDDGKTYNLKIQSKTPEFKELKRAMGRIDNSISIDTPELEKIYNDIMSGIEKADIEGSVDLIKQGRKSGLEEKLTVASADGNVSGVKDAKAKKDAEAELVRGRAVKFITPGKTQEASEEEMQEPEQMEQKPKASEIAGQLAEIMEKLKSMAEGEDPKKGKHAAKVMKYMESAKAALEALTAHETMLEEKDQAEQEKKAEKHKKNIEKIFKGIVKDENIVNRLKDKLSPKDIAALSKKLGEKGKELDEEKLARIVLNRSLKEGWAVKKK